VRVGFVVECGRDGADHKVFRLLAEHLRPGLAHEFRFMDNKRKLFDQGDAVVDLLLTSTKCDHVFLIWDLMPCDAEFQLKKPWCVQERSFLIDKLASRGVDLGRVTLLCITHELEAWLLVSGTALEELLKRQTHSIEPISHEKHPERHPNPKKTLTQLFNKHRGVDYQDMVHAHQIAEKILERGHESKMERAPSYKRFKDRLLGLPSKP
jgi:hypothetical protein